MSIGIKSCVGLICLENCRNFSWRLGPQRGVVGENSREVLKDSVEKGLVAKFCSLGVAYS